MHNQHETNHNLIPLPMRSSGGASTTGDARIEAALAHLQGFITAFQSDEQALRQAAQTFREALRLQPRQCSEVISVLQAMRRRAAACLDLLEAQERPVFLPLRYRALIPLHALDGEQTARLILELDALRARCRTTGADRERITTHVQVQTALAGCVQETRALNAALADLPGQVRDFAQQVPGYYRDPPCAPGR